MKIDQIIIAIAFSAIAASGVYYFVQKMQKGKVIITKKLDKDTQITTASGCTFTAEKGWFVTQHDTMIVLEEPDRELTVTLIENREKTAEQAVVAAWKQAKPDFAYIIQHTVSGLPQDGWDEIVDFRYDTSSAQEKLFVYAGARRVGTTWYIELVYGTMAAFERRMAGWLLVNTSFKVSGMQSESFAGKKAHKLNDTQLKEFTDFIEKARTLCKVPGVAVAIVQDDKIILEQGFGVRTLGKPEKVTPQTLFMIGSTTKALTTFMMARLIDEGKFTWDTPVTQIMPDFALGDAATTKQVLMKYMVSASAGMPRQDMEFFFNYDQATPASRIKEMRNMKPTTGFGETFQYSNPMVSAGGYIAAHTVDKSSDLGKAYDSVMQSRVFDPMNMHATTFDFDRVEAADHAAPHGRNLHDQFVPSNASQEKWVESVRPAGGAWSNVDDMARYMMTELNGGVTVEGKRVISEKNLLARREPQIKITDTLSYGLGLMTEKGQDVLSVGHDGGTMGFSSLMFFLPEHNVGLVMLTNGGGATTFTQGVKRKFMELLFDGKPLADAAVKMNVEQTAAMIAKNLETINFKPDSAWLKQFVGAYEHPTLGKIVIQEVPGGVVLDARLWKSALGEKREKDGTRKLILTEFPFAGLEFLPQQQNGIQQLVLEFGQHKYVFERK